MADVKRSVGHVPETLDAEYRLKSRERLLAMRSRYMEPEMDEENGKTRLPRIILRDSLGMKLDTFTVLQEAIYRAELNVKQSKEAKTAEEWRLPNAPLPARPDYSRAPPSLAKTREILRSKRNWRSTGNLHTFNCIDVDVDDVSFVAESINHLPKVPSLSFLHRDLWAEPKKYFQIVDQMLLHKRILSQTDKRNAVYNFPGFCSGCQRSGLCYGCERNSEPHYHIDRIMKTGGGFTYYKKDRPENEILGKHPLNWRLQFPELALKNLMQDETESKLQNHQGEFLNSQNGMLPLIPKFSNAFHLKDDQAEARMEYDRGETDDKNEDLEDLAQDKSSQNHQNNFGLESEGIEEFSVDQHTNTRDNDGAYNVDTGGKKYASGHKTLQVDMERLSSWYGSEQDPRGTEFGDEEIVLQDNSTNATDMDSTSYMGTSKYSTSQESRRTRKTVETDFSRDSGHDSRHQYARQNYDDDDDDDDNDDEDDGSPTSSQRRRLYKAPSPFKLKQKKRKAIKSRSPFSSSRQYNLPKGKGFQIKKSDKSVTQFVEFQGGDSSWKEPKQFTVKKSDKEATKFWSPTHKEKEQVPKKVSRPRKIQRAPSPDSGLENDSIQEIPVKQEPERVPSPVPLEDEKPKREKPKKTKKEQPKKSPPPVKSVSPKTPEPPEPEPEPEVVSITPEPVYEHVSPPTVPELPPLDLPPLPEITEEKKEKRLRLDNRIPIEPMPKIKDALPPPPVKKTKSPRIPKMRPHKKKPAKPAEAPVTTEEIQEMKDPLDFLAKYCIISKDRLPIYDRVFKKVIGEQLPKYERSPPLSPRTGMPLKNVDSGWSSHEINMFRDLIVLNRGQDPVKPGINEAEQYLEKICYTLEILEKKHIGVMENLHTLQTKKVQLLAEKAKEKSPEIATLAYKPKAKKSKKKKKKKKNEEVEYVFQPQRLEDITDEVIVSRIDDKLLKSLLKEPELYQLECEMDRCSERLVNIEDRLMHLEGEKNVFGMYCMEVFFSQQNDNQKSTHFRRQQSALFNKLHPDPDVEMNLEEVQGALQIINNQLLSEREYAYLFHILNLAGRRKINFKLFAVVAALSEKFIEMDPLIRNMWNRLDYNALDFKMERSKRLFSLLENGETVPYGNALASSLAVELTAGGLTPEQTKYVLSKFNREGKGFVDFMDYVTYVPLFLEIHERIISQPLRASFEF